MKDQTARILFWVAIPVVLIEIVFAVYILAPLPKSLKVENTKEIVTQSKTHAEAEADIDTNEPSREWTLLLTGDVLPARAVNMQMVRRDDFYWPFAEIGEILHAADLTLINLESPLVTNCPLTDTGMIFCGDPRFGAALAQAGVDVVNLANNHTLNYGWEGLVETEQILQSAGIGTTGYSTKSKIDEDCNHDVFCSKFLIKTVQFKKMQTNDVQKSSKHIDPESLSAQEVKVGFLGYNAVGQAVDRRVVEQQMREADKQVDVLVVSAHWGAEYTREPLPVTGNDPKELGKQFVDWGADVVVGNHPHWIQPLEWYAPVFTETNKRIYPIFYALGNTIFDQEWSRETKRGILARLHFQGEHLIPDQTEIIPIGIRYYGQAYLLRGEEREEVMRLFE